MFVLLVSSIKVMYVNLKHFNVIKSGEIIYIDYVKSSRVDNQEGTYRNTILIDKKKDTVYGGSQTSFSIGDKVQFRYRGEGGNIIFKVNNSIIRAKYDIWDWISPFLFLITLFGLYKFIKLWFSYLK
jgi:hypothetical protein